MKLTALYESDVFFFAGAFMHTFECCFAPGSWGPLGGPLVILAIFSNCYVYLKGYLKTFIKTNIRKINFAKKKLISEKWGKMKK